MSLKMIGLGFLLIVVGFFMALSDGQLCFFGKTTEAELTDAWVSTGMGRRRTKSVAVEYRFKDEKGEEVVSGDKMPLDWAPPEDGALKIVYLPSDPKTSRIAGHVGWGGCGVWVLADSCSWRESFPSIRRQ